LDKKRTKRKKMFTPQTSIPSFLYAHIEETEQVWHEEKGNNCLKTYFSGKLFASIAHFS